MCAAVTKDVPAGGPSHPFKDPSILLLCVLPKLFMNSTLRFLFPFATFFAESMGISVALFSTTLLIASEVAAPVALLISKPAAQLGAPTLASLSLVVGSLANVAVLLLPSTLAAPSLVVLCIFRLTFGVVFNLFSSAIQSSISHNTPVNVQGRAVGIVESSWTLAAFSFVGHGVLLDTFGWKMPFVVNGLLMLIAAPLIYVWLPSDFDEVDAATSIPSTSPESAASPSPSPSPSTADSTSTSAPESLLSYVSTTPSIGFFSAMILRDSAMFMVLTTYSIWLSSEHGLEASESGTITLVIAAGELIAAISMTLFADKIGLTLNQTLVNFGGVLGSLGLAFFQSSSLPISLGFMGFGFMNFEWSALTSIALTGSSYPTSVRVQMLTVMLMSMALARMIGASIADVVYGNLGGFGGVCYLAAAAQLVAAIVFVATRGEGGGGDEKGKSGERKGAKEENDFELMTQNTL